MPRGARAPRFLVTDGLGVEDDLVALNAFDPTVLDAAQALLDDLAHGRVTDVVAIGRRYAHAIYQAAAKRLAP